MADEVGDELEVRLAAAAAARRDHDIAKQHLADLGCRIDELHRQLVDLQRDRVAELKAVQRLERRSLTRVLASLRRRRRDEVVQKQAQADATAERMSDAERTLSSLLLEQAESRQRLRTLAAAAALYEAVLYEKEEHLCSSGDPRWGSLLEIADERGRLSAELAELREAMGLAAAAFAALVRVQEALRGAIAPLSDPATRADKLREAAAATSDAERHLAALRAELADFDDSGTTGPRRLVDGLTRFVDVWLDGIPTDWSAGGRTSEARQNVANCLGYVQHIQGQLHANAVRARARLSKIEAERHGLLTRELR